MPTTSGTATRNPQSVGNADVEQPALRNRLANTMNAPSVPVSVIGTAERGRLSTS
jgi:hypothetical protein